ncbi:MAG: hypothetical protein Q7S00_07910, partial [bacterium]|nr:hypothetical protein [bacterium]
MAPPSAPRPVVNADVQALLDEMEALEDTGLPEAVGTLDPTIPSSAEFNDVVYFPGRKPVTSVSDLPDFAGINNPFGGKVDLLPLCKKDVYIGPDQAASFSPEAPDLVLAENESSVVLRPSAPCDSVRRPEGDKIVAYSQLNDSHFAPDQNGKSQMDTVWSQIGTSIPTLGGDWYPYALVRESDRVFMMLDLMGDQLPTPYASEEKSPNNPRQGQNVEKSFTAINRFPFVTPESNALVLALTAWAPVLNGDTSRITGTHLQVRGFTTHDDYQNWKEMLVGGTVGGGIPTIDGSIITVKSLAQALKDYGPDSPQFQGLHARLREEYRLLPIPADPDVVQAFADALDEITPINPAALSTHVMQIAGIVIGFGLLFEYQRRRSKSDMRACHPDEIRRIVDEAMQKFAAGEQKKGAANLAALLLGAGIGCTEDLLNKVRDMAAGAGNGSNSDAKRVMTEFGKTISDAAVDTVG